MKYYIIAGEASGDLHASNLIRSLKQKDAKAEIRAWGGDLMKEQGAELVKHYRELAFMGFIEVLANLRTILRNMRFCKRDIQEWKPDVVILVDYPGFNLRIAEFAKKEGLKVVYYISPKIWAWKKSRVYKIKKYVDKMLVIFPFEKEFYAKYGYSVEYVGNPLLDSLDNLKDDEQSFRKKNNLSDLPIIALLPGSRKQEIEKMLSKMMSVIDDFPNHQFAIAGAPAIPDDFYQNIIQAKKVSLIKDNTPQLIKFSDAALVASGTATLETALLETPEVVCYRMNTITYRIAKLVVKVPYISLVNLIMDKEVVKELIQEELNTANLREELNMILYNSERRKSIADDYKALKVKLGNGGASDKAAESITRFIKEIN